MYVIIIGVFIAVAFLIQTVLAFFQIRNFARTFHKVRQDGRILIGKNPRRFRSGSLMLVGLDADDRIRQIQVMKGISVFDRFKQKNTYNGELFIELATDYQTLHKMRRTERECILNAYRNFINYKTNNLSFSDFDTSGPNLLELPVFTGIFNKTKLMTQKLIRR
ncbi:transcriptional regulator GutM [Periweissella ghanensis]|uniref:Glucitol operon activator n=1 Tax=Periweissella ghanensis TaxID=467997 RepID=A0ABN8BN36_9LACO|nr:transcriptional regulator GutM [Periweissella ghanensis]CAH0417860.1 hypothetical protein WGH24286_00276 [Periweissella ghanensis]